MNTRCRIAVIGAGVIGRTHIDTLLRADVATLAAIVDPLPEAEALASSHDVPYFGTIESLLESHLADAAIIATPNHTHLPVTVALLEAGLPVLLEKPVASTMDEALQLQAALQRTGVPLLVGHHRRHNPIITAARKAIEAGSIGQLVTATVMSTLAKPESYFDTPWRTLAGQGGPLLINLIHEVDLLRYFFGEVKAVTGVVRNSERGRDVEDNAAAILEFHGGGLAILIISDAAAGPWAWDLSAGENPERFPAHAVSAHAYAGTRGALSLPDLRLWKHPAEPDWTVPMSVEFLPFEPADPYSRQIDHFVAVARGQVDPLVSCTDGLRNMQLIEAVKCAGETGLRQELPVLFAVDF